MKNVKRLLALLLAVAMLVTLCACNKNASDKESSEKASSEKESSDKESSDKTSSNKNSSKSAESAAESYVKATIEGDTKTLLSLMLGDYQAYFEEEVYGDKKDRNSLFEVYEEYAEELDLDVTIEDWNDYYSALKKIAAAQNEEEYGEGYSISYRVVETKKIRSSDLEDIQDKYDTDAYEDYIDVDLIEEGKKVYVRIFIDSDDSPEAYIYTVYVVKYDGKWKVVQGSYDDRDDD